MRARSCQAAPTHTIAEPCALWNRWARITRSESLPEARTTSSQSQQQATSLSEFGRRSLDDARKSRVSIHNCRVWDTNTAIAAYRCIFVLLSMLHTVYKSPQNCDQPLCFSCEHGCVTQVMCWQHVTARRTRLLISHRANTTSIRLTFYHLQRDCNHCVSQSLLLFALVLDLRWSVVCSSLGRSF